MDNHERTINFAFFFVQNNLRGKLSGYWKWQIHQSTPKPCWCQILRRACLIRCGRSCVFITTRDAFVGGWLRHQERAGFAGPRECGNHDDLFARHARNQDWGYGVRWMDKRVRCEGQVSCKPVPSQELKTEGG